MKKKSKEEITSSINEMFNGEIAILDWKDYKNNKSKFLVNDLSCDHNPFEINYNHLQQGQRCPTCGNINSKKGERLTEEKLNIYLNSHIFFKDYEILNFNEYESIHKKNIRIKHLNCGQEFTTKLNNFLSNMNGCPYCRTSKIEIKLEDHLVKNNIQYEMHQRNLSNLKGKSRSLEIDFVIKNKNNKPLYLELNGELHYKDKSITRDRFSDTISYDKKKVNYFLNISSEDFMVIPYWNFNKVIDIINFYLNSDFESLKKFDITFIRNKKTIQEISNLN
jgi:Zn finger protein HypA/HybF involved in hydrogenase expression